MGAKKIISLLLALSLLTGTVGSISACTPLAGEGAPQAETEKENVLGGGLLVTPEETPEEESPVTITARALSAEEYAENDIMPIAESAQQLTATLSPSGSEGSVDWSVAWKNPSSEWASGKTVTDYVTVTPTKDGALTANVSCLQAFGEQVIITAALRGTSARATVTADYRQRKGFTIHLRTDHAYNTNLTEFKMSAYLLQEGQMSLIKIPYPFGDWDLETAFYYFNSSAASSQDAAYNYHVTLGLTPGQVYTIVDNRSAVMKDLLFYVDSYGVGYSSSMKNAGYNIQLFTGVLLNSAKNLSWFKNGETYGSLSLSQFRLFQLFGISPEYMTRILGTASDRFNLVTFRDRLKTAYQRLPIDTYATQYGIQVHFEIPVDIYDDPLVYTCRLVFTFD